MLSVQKCGVGLVNFIRTNGKCWAAVKDAIGSFYWRNWGVISAQQWWAVVAGEQDSGAMGSPRPT